MQLALGILGLTPADVTVLQVGGSQSRLVALKAGTIDATVLSPEEAMAAQKLGLNPLLDFVAKGVEFPHVNIVAREEYLQEQAPLVKRFMAAYLEAIRFFKTHKEEAVRKMMVLSRLNDREIAEKAFDYLDGPIRRITAPDTPVPYSPPLEEFFLPKVSDVIRVARELYAY